MWTGALAHLCVALFVLGHPDQASDAGPGAASRGSGPRSPQQSGPGAALRRHPALRGPGHAGLAADGRGRDSDRHRARPAALSWASAGSIGGWPCIELGRIEDGLADIEQGVAMLEAAGSRLLINVGDPSRRGARPRGAARGGVALGGRRHGPGRRMSPPSFSFQAEEVRRHGRSAAFAARVRLGRGRSVLPTGDRDRASQGARMWELRAALSLARLWSDRGGRARPATCSPRSTGGSPKASTCPTCARPRRCSTHWLDARAAEAAPDNNTVAATLVMPPSASRKVPVSALVRIRAAD